MTTEKRSGIRITFVIKNLAWGGRTPLHVAAGLRDLGHEVSVLLCNPRPGYHGEIPSGIEYFCIEEEPAGAPGNRPRSWFQRLHPATGFHFARVADPETLRRPEWTYRRSRFFWMQALWTLRLVRALLVYIRGQRPQCMLPSLPGPKTAVLVAGLLSQESPPVIFHVHLAIRRTLHYLRYRLLFKYVDHIITVSEGVASEVRTQIGVPSSRVTAIHNPLPLEKIRSAMQETPDHPWLRDGSELPLVVGVGRLAPEKDFTMLLHSIRLVSERRKLRLVILGDGPLKEELLVLRRKLGLEDVVSLPGWADNPFAFMARADLFVLSSKWEGFGNVLVEALACGTPVISTDCPHGPSEILEGGRFGALTPVGDPAALAQAVLQALENPPSEQEREALRARAAQFSVERCAQAYERVIAACTSQARLTRTHW